MKFVQLMKWQMGAVAIDKTNLFQAFLCFLTFGSEIKFIEVPTHGGNFVCRKIGYDGYKKKHNFILVLKVISSATKCF